MAINWGIALGQAAKTGMGVYDQVQTDRLKQLQYQTGMNTLQNQVGLQQDLSQLDPNSPSYQQDVQAAMARHGQPLQSAQYGRDASLTTGQNLSNTATSNMLQVGRDAHDFYANGESLVNSGDLAGASKMLLSKATSLGIPYQLSQDGSSVSVNGQSYDLTHAPTLLAGYGALSNGMLRNGLMQADPRMYPQITNADASMVRSNADMQNANTQASIAPSTIEANKGRAAMDYANASEAPARIGMLEAQTGEFNARTGLTDAQTQGANVANQEHQQAAQIATQLSAMSPQELASPEGQALTQKYLMLASPGGMAFARAYGGANTAAARAQATGTRQNWTVDPNNPNTYLDKTSGTVVTMGKGGQMKVSKLGGGLGAPGGKTTASGVPTAKDAQGNTGYQGADGQWYGTEQEALGTYRPQTGGATTQGQPQAAIQRPPLPPPGYVPGQGQGGVPSLPGLYDNPQY